MTKETRAKPANPKFKEIMPAALQPWGGCDKHLRRTAVEAATGLSRSTIYDMMDRGLFPRPVRVGRRAVAWPESAIQQWLADRPTADKSTA